MRIEPERGMMGPKRRRAKSEGQAKTGPGGAPFRAATRRAAGAEVFFAVTLFVSAALLFAVQPMFAKMVLPLLGGAGRLEYVPGVLSGRAAVGIPLRAPFAEVAGTAAAGGLAPAAAVFAVVRPADRGGPGLAAAAGRLSGPLVVDAVVGLGGPAVSGGLGHRADAAGLVQPDQCSGRPRPLFPLCRQQSGEPASLAQLSVADRIALDPWRAGRRLGRRLRSADAADRRLCGAVVAIVTGRRDGAARRSRGARGGTDCRASQPAAGCTGWRCRWFLPAC